MNNQQVTPLQESSARIIVNDFLSRLGWVIDDTRSDCNVFTERAKTLQQNNRLNYKRPDYLLYEGDKPIAVIEAKRPGHSLKDAITQADNLYASPLDIDIVFATDGTLFQSYDRRSKGPLLLDGEPIFDLLPPNLTTRFAKDGPSLLTPTKISQTKSELMAIFSRANDSLRSNGLRDGMERFGEFSNLLFLKLISEIEIDRDNRNEPRRLEQRYCWEAFSKLPARNMLDYLNDTVLPRLVQAYNHSGDVFQPRLNITNADTLKEVVNNLSNLSLLDAESDVKGDAFEYFLKHSVTVGNDLGEYFTPRHIVKLVVDLIDPNYLEKVYDPCCGTGGFLIEAFRHISRKVKLTEETRRVLENETIFARELTSNARIAKMNMILAGDGHTHIHQMDSLESPVKGEYDVVLTNFPFSQKTNYARLYGLDTENGNPVFLKHVVDACKENGRIGVVVPEGLLFSENRPEKNVRQYVLNNCSVIAVIALHEYTFLPYTGQPTSVLILEKKKSSNNPVWFFEVLEDGFKKTGSKKGRPVVPNGKNDLVTLRSIWSNKIETDQSFFVELDRIRKNSYKLSLSSYRAQRGVHPDWVPLGGKKGVCEIKVGATPNRNNDSFWAQGIYPWVTIEDMKDRYVKVTEETITDKAIVKTSVKKLLKGTVLLSFKLTIGKVAIAGCDLYTNEAIVGLVPKDDRILSEYLYYLMPTIDLKNYAQPATKGRTLNKKILENIRIPVPSITKQKAFITEMKEMENIAISLRKEASDMDQAMLEHGRSFVSDLNM